MALLAAQQNAPAGNLGKVRDARIRTRRVMVSDMPAAFVFPPPLGKPAEQQQNEAFVPSRHVRLDAGHRATGGERIIVSPEAHQRLAQIGVDIGHPVGIGAGNIGEGSLEADNRLLKPIQRRQ